MSDPIVIPKDKKIIGYKILAEETPKDEGFIPEHMNEGVERPFKLHGTTYKLKPLGHERGLYLTINDIVMNAGTDHEQRYPYEVFLNSRQMENFEWITALTCFISAVWRKGGNINFSVDELESTFSPKGSYMGPDHHNPGKNKFYDSVVSEIGSIVRLHFIELGLMKPVYNINQEQEMKQAVQIPEEELNNKEDTSELEPGTFRMDKKCSECDSDIFRMADNCPTCVDCGNSKCG